MTTSNPNCRVNSACSVETAILRNDSEGKLLKTNAFAGFSGISGHFGHRKLYRMKTIVCVCVNFISYIFPSANLENPANARNNALFRLAGFPEHGGNFPATLQAGVFS